MTFEGFLNAFSLGGGWMYGIVVLGLVFYGLLTVQFIRLKDSDYTWILWGLFISTITFGLFGSVVGIIQAYAALDFVVPPDQFIELFKYIGIAMYTTAFSFIVAAIGTVPLGFVTHFVSRTLQEKNKPEPRNSKSAGFLWTLVPIAILFIPLAVLVGVTDEGSKLAASIGAAFEVGGPIMYYTGLLSIAFGGLLLFQFIKHKTHDVIWILWTLFILFSLLGTLGIASGFIQAGAEGGIASRDEFARAISGGIGIVLNTSSYAIICSFMASIPLGIATYLVKRRTTKAM
ncbi:MAG: hypothetical protein GY854_09185 [Deltaproteobacteria bacterium]|nr:hypothetical protein [Deltaproteobacteria bacterium]